MNAPAEEYQTHMTTLSAVLEKLRQKKIDNEFIMSPQGFSAGKNKFYQPEGLKIVRTYRFEGESNPGDNSVIYIIEANDGLIGYSIDAYGAYSNHDAAYDDFLKKIPVEEKNESHIF